MRFLLVLVSLICYFACVAQNSTSKALTLQSADANYHSIATKPENFNQIQYSSCLLSRVDGEPSRSTFMYDSTIKKRTALRITNLPIVQIISKAHQDLMPINESRILIESSRKTEILNWNRENLWCYEIRVPSEKYESLYRLIRQDIARYFGLSCAIEKRKVQAVVLKVVSHAKVNELTSRDTGTEGKLRFTKEGTIITNGSLETVVNLIQNNNREFVILNGTDFSANINLTLKSSFKDLKALKAELLTHGLDLVNEVRDAEMIVVKDIVN